MRRHVYRGSLGQFLSRLGGHVVYFGVKCSLQGPHVRDDSPAVVAIELVRVRAHLALALGDDLIDPAVGQLAQAFGVVRRRRYQAVLRSDAVALATLPMADSAIDLE